MLSNILRHWIEDTLLSRIQEIQPVHGGDISLAYAVIDNQGRKFFLKYNDSLRHELILTSEYKALSLWKDLEINCPQPIALYKADTCSALLLLHLEISNQWNTSSLDNFVSQLVKLHSNKNDRFGFGEMNCIGSLEQQNSWFDKFENYYWFSRIKPQIELANSNGFLNPVHEYGFMMDIFKAFPKEQACLIHGDLWSGNYIIDPQDNAYLIDPSISYSSREMDIAMMQLFGNYPQEVYRLYNEHLPLNDGWEDRIKYFQLYYLLVHLNIFGSGYLNSVQSILFNAKNEWKN